MKTGFVYTVLILSFSGMLTTSIVRVGEARGESHSQDNVKPQSPIKVEDEIKADLARQLGLEAQRKVGADAPVSPIVPHDVTTNVARQLPSKCVDHWQEEIEKLTNDQYTRDLWFNHIRECKECCAPLMIEIFGAHVTLASSGPHGVLFFDYDHDELKDGSREKLKSLFNKSFDKTKHKLLLVGRASKTGNAIYNERLSRRRSEKVKQYLEDEGIINKDTALIMFFGYHPPQLTPVIAKKYKIDFKELENITFKGDDPKGEYRVNQSVVVILYKSENSDHDTSSTDHNASAEVQNP